MKPIPAYTGRFATSRSGRTVVTVRAVTGREILRPNVWSLNLAPPRPWGLAKCDKPGGCALLRRQAKRHRALGVLHAHRGVKISLANPAASTHGTTRGGERAASLPPENATPCSRRDRLGSAH
jgi:hypothetical protein